ncbi:MAG TPA: hypothetical protein PKD92_00575 [Novosphingobium sp.]|nr:hypothetical protein [Novosphingobium sp.]
MPGAGSWRVCSALSNSRSSSRGKLEGGSPPASYNGLQIDGETIRVTHRNLEHVPDAAMRIDAIPEDALPPREPGEPVAPVHRVPDIDPPVH